MHCVEEYEYTLKVVSNSSRICLENMLTFCNELNFPIS